MQKGRSIKAAMPILEAAMTIEGASAWASRMNKEADETAIIPDINPINGEKGAFFSISIYYPINTINVNFLFFT